MFFHDLLLYDVGPRLVADVCFSLGNFNRWKRHHLSAGELQSDRVPPVDAGFALLDRAAPRTQIQKLETFFLVENFEGWVKLRIAVL